MLHKLIVAELPAGTSSELVSGYFSRFGEVLDVHVARHDERPTCTASVRFASPGSLEAALATSEHLIAGRPVAVSRLHASQEGCRVYVVCSKFCSENCLRAEFKRHGMITTCKVLRDRRHQSRGCAFITYETMEAAASAVALSNGVEVRGRALKVMLSDERRPSELAMEGAELQPAAGAQLASLPCTLRATAAVGCQGSHGSMQTPVGSYSPGALLASRPVPLCLSPAAAAQGFSSPRAHVAGPLSSPAAGMVTPPRLVHTSPVHMPLHLPAPWHHCGQPPGCTSPLAGAGGGADEAGGAGAAIPHALGGTPAPLACTTPGASAGGEVLSPRCSVSPYASNASCWGSAASCAHGAHSALYPATHLCPSPPHTLPLSRLESSPWRHHVAPAELSSTLPHRTALSPARCEPPTSLPALGQMTNCCPLSAASATTHPGSCAPHLRPVPPLTIDALSRAELMPRSPPAPVSTPPSLRVAAAAEAEGAAGAGRGGDSLAVQELMRLRAVAQAELLAIEQALAHEQTAGSGGHAHQLSQAEAAEQQAAALALAGAPQREGTALACVAAAPSEADLFSRESERPALDEASGWVSGSVRKASIGMEPPLPVDVAKRESATEPVRVRPWPFQSVFLHSPTLHPSAPHPALLMEQPSQLVL